MNTYIKMIRDFFPIEEHSFFVMTSIPKSEIALLDDPQMYTMQGSSNKEKKTFFNTFVSNYDYILWHGLMYGMREMYHLATNKKAMKKSIWIMRGIDLYNWKRDNQGLKGFIANSVNRYVRNNIRGIAYILQTDKAIFHKTFGRKNIISYFTPYPMSKEVFEELDDNIFGERSNGYKWIQIGNNAYPFNRHMDMLKALSRFTDEKIKIFIPLSYGTDWFNSKNNLLDDLDLFKDIAKEKIVLLKKLMPPKEYSHLLYNMDIAVMAANRQNALGNILRLLYSGCKVYLSKQSPVYDLLISEGLEIFAVEDISNMSYEEFTKPSDNQKARAWIKSQHHPNHNVKYWESLFVDMKGSPILSEKIEEENKQTLQTHIIKPKLNYFDVGLYDSMFRIPAGNTKHIVIMGTGSILPDLLEAIYLRMQGSRAVTIKAIYSNDVDTICNICTFADVVGKIDDYIPQENDFIICALDDKKEHKRVIETLRKKEVFFISVIHPEAKISGFVQYGMDCFINKEARVLYDTKIGNHSYVNCPILNEGVEIASFSNID